MTLPKWGHPDSRSAGRLVHGLIRRSGVMGDGAQHPGLSRAIAAAAAQPLRTFSLAFENATVGLALFSPCGGACLRANPRFCAALELTPEALSASSLPQILQQLERGNTAASPAANGFNLNAATAVLSGDRDHSIARLSLNRNGQPAGWFDLRLKAIRDSGGTLIHVLAELNDVSEAVAQTEYLQAAASAGVVGIWDWDPVHDVLTWDPVMYAALEWQARRLRRRSRGMVAACPLEGLVRSVASPEETFADLRIFSGSIAITE